MQVQLSPSVKEVEARITERFGLCPSFFKLASYDAEAMNQLFNMACIGYLDNPLPSVFKEKLFAYLSRFCNAPYCMARHCAFLLGHGNIAGDANCETVSFDEVLRLVQRPFPSPEELRAQLQILAAVDSLDDWPISDENIENSLLICAAPVFLRRGDYLRCQSELNRVLGPRRYDQLLMLLAFVRTANFWAETHPDIEYEDDLKQLLDEHQELSDWQLSFTDVVSSELQHLAKVETSELRITHSSPEASQRRLQAIFDHGFQLMGLLSLDGNLLFANRAALSAAGGTESDLLGKPFWNAPWWSHSPELQQQLRQAIAQAATGEFVRFEVTHPTSSGELMDIDFSLTPVRDQNGNVVELIPEGRDITERKRAEQRVRESEQFTRRVLNNLFAFVGVLDLDGTLIEANDAPLKASGIRFDEVVGKKFWECHWWNYSPDVQQQLREAFERSKQGEIVRYDVEARMMGESRMAIDFQIAPLRDADGEITHLIPSGIDITERKRAIASVRRLNDELEDRVSRRTAELRAVNAQLDATSQRLQNLLDNVDVIVSNWEMPSMQATFVNQRAENILGYPLEDWYSKPRFWETTLLHPDDREEASRFCCEETRAGRDHDFVYRARHADGSTVWIHEFVSVVTDESKETSQLTVVMVDITERKRVETDLRRLAKVFTDSADAIFIKSLNGEIFDLNDAAVRQYGWTRDELVGKSIKVIVPPEEHSDRDQLMAKCVRGEEVRSVEVNRITKSGRKLPVSLTLSLLTNDSGEPIGIATISEDITQRKLAEAQLQESHDRLARVLEIETAGVLFWDVPTGCLTDANDTFLKLTGYSRREVQQGELTWQKLTPPEYVESTLAAIEKYYNTGRIGPFEKEYFCKDGTRKWFVLTGSALDDNTCVEFCIDITDRKNLERHLLEISDSERRRIASDLHDDVGQEMAGLTMMAETLALNLQDKDQPEFELAKRIATQLERSHRKMKIISRGLNPAEVDPLRLDGAIRELAMHVNSIHGIECTFRYDEDIEFRDSETTTHLYRIVQEATSNAIRHAQPNKINVELSKTRAGFELRIADDGIGFAHTSKSSSGFGLRSMGYRCELIGGKLKILSPESGGTIVSCEIAT